MIEEKRTYSSDEVTGKCTHTIYIYYPGKVFKVYNLYLYIYIIAVASEVRVTAEKDSK